MRLAMKNERLRRQKKSATENPATQVSGKNELLQELGQQELLTPDGNVPCESTAPRSRPENEGSSQGSEAQPNGQARGRKGWDGNPATALGRGSPKDFCPHCTSAGSSQPTHRHHQPGFTRAGAGITRPEDCCTDFFYIKESKWGQIATHL